MISVEPPKFSVHGAYAASGRYIHQVRDKPISSKRNPLNTNDRKDRKDHKDRKDRNDRNDTKIMSFEIKHTTKKKTGLTGACRIFRAIAIINRKEKHSAQRHQLFTTT